MIRVVRRRISTFVNLVNKTGKRRLLCPDQEHRARSILYNQAQLNPQIFIAGISEADPAVELDESEWVRSHTRMGADAPIYMSATRARTRTGT